MELLEKEIPITFLRNVTWVFVNLCRHKDSPLDLNIARAVLPGLKHLLSYDDVTVCITKTEIFILYLF